MLINFNKITSKQKTIAMNTSVFVLLKFAEIILIFISNKLTLLTMTAAAVI